MIRKLTWRRPPRPRRSRARAEITGNGGYTGFVEAWNISLDENNAVIGNGPTWLSAGSAVPLPGGDQLTG